MHWIGKPWVPWKRASVKPIVGQYLTAGVTHPRFAEVLNSLVTDGQAARINRALESLR